MRGHSGEIVVLREESSGYKSMIRRTCKVPCQPPRSRISIWLTSLFPVVVPLRLSGLCLGPTSRFRRQTRPLLSSLQPILIHQLEKFNISRQLFMVQTKSLLESRRQVMCSADSIIITLLPLFQATVESLMQCLFYRLLESLARGEECWFQLCYF